MHRQIITRYKFIKKVGKKLRYKKLHCLCFFNSSSVTQFEDPFHRKIQNLTMSSIFNVDDDGMKEICIYSFSAENSGKV